MGEERISVTDQSQNTGEAEESETEENDEEEFELEGLMAREQGASVLRRLADGVESGSVELGRDEGPVNLPEELEVEVEYEEEEKEAELEVELEWSIDDEPVSTKEDESDVSEEPEASEGEVDEQE